MANKLVHRYSGNNSRTFWNRVNAIKDEKTMTRLYRLGCRLQNLEGEMLKKLTAAETAEKKGKKKHVV